MAVADLLTEAQLPIGFRYPREFLRMVELGLTRLEPWWILEGELLLDRAQGLASRYPRRTLVPFACRQDNDDVACWDVGRDCVAIVHDFASPGWEQRKELHDFNEWLRLAIEDFIEFGTDGA